MDKDTIATMAEETVDSNTNNATEKEAGNSTKPEDKKRGLIDEVVDTIAKGTAQAANPNKVADVTRNMKSVLTTLFALNTLDEYQLGPIVDGQRYRYDDYQAPEDLANLVIAKRVVAADNASSVDFLKKDMYKAEGSVLSPADFALAIREIRKALRSNVESKPISRPDLALLSEATIYAVNGGKVVDRTQKTIYFLTYKFDEEARVPIREWAKTFAVKLFN
jgi:hypothetical protein